MGLLSINGGSRKNAIPRDAQAVIWIESTRQTQLDQFIKQMEATIRSELLNCEEDFFIKSFPATESSAGRQALSLADTDRAIAVLLALPDAVARMSANMEGLVETSSNLATLEMVDNRLCIVSSQRSSSMSRLDEITATIHSIGRLAGAHIQDKEAYPAWQPAMDSELLHRCKSAFRKLYDQDPVIQVIHAGLECAIIGGIYPEMDMISVGPTLRNAHSPDERLHIPSITKVWDFLVELLDQMKS